MLKRRREICFRQSQVHRLNFSERGTPEERAGHTIAVYDSLGNARKRANSICFRDSETKLKEEEKDVL